MSNLPPPPPGGTDPSDDVPPAVPTPPPGPPAAPPAPPAPPVPPGYGAPPPASPPPPGGYTQPSPDPASPWGAPPAPQYGTPQYGTPQYGTPQYGAPQYGSPQPPAAPYQYGIGLPSSAVLASPGKRIGGYLIDVVILVVAIGLCWIPFLVLAASSSSTTVDEYGFTTNEMSGGAVAAMLVALAITVVVPIAYHVVMVALKGQTLGAMAVKVKVVRLSDGETPGWGPAILRWLPNAIGLVPYCGGCLSFGLMIWALVNLFNNERRQTPFDLAAKTVVIDVS
ncbi:MAG TPA: RDD family protein [Microthrixaceae bacterium]|nr:RDD family protein [Microthrixaceae bacterium]MCO5306358.1 RDD family protein [Microthrixaceae bacterium]HMX07127.1 RDD family protein [Microthrixaceae bacterium]HMY88591.1 RDD family protein [Microthrixaceae bacterium]HNB93646.1 RDD family protein [Microthrixaceae bacterium]